MNNIPLKRHAEVEEPITISKKGSLLLQID